MIDSHAHLSSPDMIADIDGVVARAKQAGVKRIVNICTDEPSLKEGLLFAKRYSEIVNTAATTPHDVEKEGESFFPLVKRAAEKGELVAIGETGLDYYYEHSNREVQQHYLKRYFNLAIEQNLPLVIHCRDAFDDLFNFADEYYHQKPAVLHCFTGNERDARGVVERGWFLSVSGIVTFNKSQALRDAIKTVPLENLLIETDAPFLAPQSHRGKKNEPSFLRETLQKVAEVKQTDPKKVEEITTNNAVRFFSLI